MSWRGCSTIGADFGALAQKRLVELAFVAFDVETTGLDSRADRIVEVGAVKFDRSGVLDTYGQLVNPGRPIPPALTAIHDITDEMVAKSPPITAIVPEFMEFVGNAVLVAHNAQFDVGFFDAALAEAGIEPLPGPILCTRELSRGIFLGLSDYKLTTLARFLGIPAVEHHHALADAGYSAQVFRRCMSYIDPEWNMTLTHLLKYHGPFFRFRPSMTPTLEVIRQALQASRPVRIEYRAATGEVTQRDITPLQIDGYGLGKKVVAYCHLRRENRTFRLDCILRIL